MRKIALALLALGVAFTATPSMAAPILFDSFTYPNGNLIGNGGWLNYSGAGTEIQVVSGRAVGLGTNPPDDHVLFAPQALTAKTYACFDVIIPAVVGAPKAIYFAELKDGGAANLVSRVYVLPIAGGWTFGLSHSSTSATVGVVPWTAALSYDVNYHLVINYDPVAHSSTLWVNPVNELSASVSIVNTAIPALAVSGFGLRETTTASTLPAAPNYSGGISDWGYSVDNLGIGSTFNDACDLSTPAKPATWGGIKGLYR